MSIYDVEVAIRNVRVMFDATWRGLDLGGPDERPTRGGTIEEFPPPERPEVVQIRRGSLELLLSLPGAFVAGAGAITAVVALAEKIFNCGFGSRLSDCGSSGSRLSIGFRSSAWKRNTVG